MVLNEHPVRCGSLIFQIVETVVQTMELYQTLDTHTILVTLPADVINIILFVSLHKAEGTPQMVSHNALLCPAGKRSQTTRLSASVIWMPQA